MKSESASVLKTEEEKWVPISGREGEYEVSNMGRVKSLHRLRAHGKSVPERILKPTLGSDSSRYYRVVICTNGVGRLTSVARLVAAAFTPNPFNKPCVNHIDGNKLNDSAKNLEWCSHKENMIHAVSSGIHCGRKKICV